MIYLLSFVYTKNYWNRTTIVEIIVGGWVVSFFETQCRSARADERHSAHSAQCRYAQQPIWPAVTCLVTSPLRQPHGEHLPTVMRGHDSFKFNKFRLSNIFKISQIRFLKFKGFLASTLCYISAPN